MFGICFVEPRIAGNTGSAIRLAAATGAHLHLVDPLFDLADSKLRRAGLDYHDLAVVTVHATFDAALAAFGDDTRLFAFTTSAARAYTDVAYRPGDVLVFGSEPTGLSEEVLEHERISDRLRIPMQPSRRSMNLANCASIAVYEAWRQHDFAGGH